VFFCVLCFRFVSQQRTSPDGTDGAQDEWVRIDMRQMIMLWGLGHEARGPINGPNEGLNLYEVPKSWLQLVALAPTPTPSQLPTGVQLLAPAPTPTLSQLPKGDRAYPCPCPIPSPHSGHKNTPDNRVIDPVLLEPTNANAVAGPSTPSQLPTGDWTYPRPHPIQSQPSKRSDPANVGPINSNADAGPSEPVDDAEVSGSGDLGLPSGLQTESGGAVTNQSPDPDSGLNEGPATEPLIRSPPARPQARSTKKRNVMSTDDLALLEAKELLKGTSRRSRTRTRRRG
jgi:hypothetical protein